MNSKKKIILSKKFKIIASVLTITVFGMILSSSSIRKNLLELINGIKTSAADYSGYEVSDLGQLQNLLASNKGEITEAITNNDNDRCKELYNEILKTIDNNTKNIEKDFKKAEEIVNDEDYKEAKKRLNKIKESYKTLLDKKEEIKEAVNNDDIEKYTELLSDKDIFGEEVNSYDALGDELPRSNDSEEVNVEEYSSFVSQALEEYPVDDDKSDLDQYLKETIDTKITDVIKDKSNELGNSPLEIYQFVRNNINYEQYAGSRKGATGALEQLAGNDYDQSSLLIALLRNKNIPARYVTGTVDIDINTAMDWTGAETAEVAARILASMGNKTIAMSSGGKIVAIRVEHVWVEAYCSLGEYRGLGNESDNKIWIPLDPSFKTYKKIEGSIGEIKEKILSEYTFENEGILGNSSEDGLGKTYVNNDEFNYNTDALKSLISEYINEDDLKDKRVIDVVGGLEIVPENLELLPLSIPNTLVSIDNKSSEISNDKREKINISLSDTYGIDGQLTLEKTAVELYGKKLTLSFEPASENDMNVIKKYGDIFNTPAYLIQVKPVIKADGVTISEGTSIGYGEIENFSITLGRIGLNCDTITAVLNSGGLYALGLDYGTISENELNSINDRINSITPELNDENYFTDDVAGEILNGTIKSYFAKLDGINKVIAESENIRDVRSLSFGISGFKPSVKYMYNVPVDVKLESVYVDIGGDAHTVVSRCGDNDAEKLYMLKTGAIASEMESSIIEDFYGIPAISTTTILQKAREEGQTIYNIDKNNINEVLPLLNIDSYVKNEVVNAVNSGKSVTIPQNEINYCDWTGSVYIVMDEETGAAGYMISGGLAGGEGAIDLNDNHVDGWEVFGHFLSGAWEGIKGAIPFIALALLTPFAPAIVALIVNIFMMVMMMIFIVETVEEIALLTYAYNNNLISAQDYWNSMADIAGMIVGGLAAGKAAKKFASSSFYKGLLEKSINLKAKQLGLEPETGKTIYERNGRYQIDEAMKAASKAKEAGVPEEIIRNAANELSPKGFRNFCETISKLRELGKYDELLRKSIYEDCKNLNALPDTILDKAQKASDKLVEIKDSIKKAEKALFDSIKLKLYDLGENVGFRFQCEELALADGDMLLIKKSEINNYSEYESYATKSGSALRLQDIFSEETVSGIIEGRYKVVEGGTVIRVKSGSNVVEAKIVPKGYLSSEQMIKQAELGIIDVKKMGYSSVEAFKEVITNTNKYLESNGGRAPTIINSKKAGQSVDVVDSNGNTVKVEYDAIGYVKYEGDYVKADVNIANDSVVIEKGVNNMTSKEHMKAATRQFCEYEQNKANKSGKSLIEQLKQDGFNASQIEQIINSEAKIDNYTWHHNQELGRMQLIDKKVHSNTRHNGGFSLWGKKE